MTKIEKLNKILNNNGRLFKIFNNNRRLFKIYSTPEERLYRITDNLEVEYKSNGYWAESFFSLSDILNSSIILVNDDICEETIIE